MILTHTLLTYEYKKTADLSCAESMQHPLYHSELSCCLKLDCSLLSRNLTNRMEVSHKRSIVRFFLPYSKFITIHWESTSRIQVFLTSKGNGSWFKKMMVALNYICFIMVLFYNNKDGHRQQQYSTLASQCSTIAFNHFTYKMYTCAEKALYRYIACVNLALT